MVYATSAGCSIASWGRPRHNSVAPQGRRRATCVAAPKSEPTSCPSAAAASRRARGSKRESGGCSSGRRDGGSTLGANGRLLQLQVAAGASAERPDPSCSATFAALHQQGRLDWPARASASLRARRPRQRRKAGSRCGPAMPRPPAMFSVCGAQSGACSALRCRRTGGGGQEAPTAGACARTRSKGAGWGLLRRFTQCGTVPQRPRPGVSGRGPPLSSGGGAGPPARSGIVPAARACACVAAAARLRPGVAPRPHLNQESRVRPKAESDVFLTLLAASWTCPRAASSLQGLVRAGQAHRRSAGGAGSSWKGAVRSAGARRPTPRAVGSALSTRQCGGTGGDSACAAGYVLPTSSPAPAQVRALSRRRRGVTQRSATRRPEAP